MTPGMSRTAHGRARRACASFGAAPLDMLAEAAERAEDLDIVVVIRAQLKTVSLRHGQRDLQNIDGIEAQAVAVERRVRTDIVSGQIKIEGADDQVRRRALLGAHAVRSVHPAARSATQELSRPCTALS